MKKIYVITGGLLISLFVFITCKQDPVQSPPSTPTPVNHPPLANAGKDTTITLASCGSTGTIGLDGSTSSDPDNSPLAFLWRVLFAPNNNFISTNMRSAHPIFSNLRAGEYDIELTVADPAGLTAKDTVSMYVFGSTGNGDNLDITINGSFHFEDNYADCYYCYNPCCFYDLSYVVNATGYFSPIGNFNFYGYEEADTATTSGSHSTYFGLYVSINNANAESVYGTSSVNLKKVFQGGGGSISGIFTPTDGSALVCDPNVLKNLTPLTVTGTMDTTAKTITLKIKGKVYF